MDKMIANGIFITGTGTDVGKTYVTALIVKWLKNIGKDVAYYKAAISGAKTVEESDAGYVRRISGIEQSDESLVSYLFDEAVSPHLAAKHMNTAIDPERIKEDFEAVKKEHETVIVEGSGGIVCPIRWDEEKKILLKDIVKELGLPVLIVADAGLGTINAVVTTVEYIKNEGIEILGIILNRYSGDDMQRDNAKMIEEITGYPVVARVETGAQDIVIMTD